MYLAWFDADRKKSVSEKIAEARERYIAKFGSEPAVCLVNPTDATAESAVELRPVTYIGRNCFWIGVEDGEDREPVPGTATATLDAPPAPTAPTATTTTVEQPARAPKATRKTQPKSAVARVAPAVPAAVPVAPKSRATATAPRGAPAKAAPARAPKRRTEPAPTPVATATTTRPSKATPAPRQRRAKPSTAAAPPQPVGAKSEALKSGSAAKKQPARAATVVKTRVAAETTKVPKPARPRPLRRAGRAATARRRKGPVHR